MGMQSPLRTYKDLTVGESSFIKFIEYELYISLLSPLPGGAGFYLRKIFYPRLFKKVGSGLIIGRMSLFDTRTRLCWATTLPSMTTA